MNNLENKIFITLDVDWASDGIINYTKNLLIKEKVKALWLITHDSPAIRELFELQDLFEIGLHPNFLPNSTQGQNVETVMDGLLGTYPKARIIRMHSAYQSTPLFRELITKFSQIRLDLSLFLPEASSAEAHKLYFGKDYLIRIPYIWEDDFEAMKPLKIRNYTSKDRFQQVHGFRIFNFHPIHIYLNTFKLDNYFQLKKNHIVSNVDLDSAEPYCNKESKGTKTFLIELIKSGMESALFKELNIYKG